MSMHPGDAWRDEDSLLSVIERREPIRRSGWPGLLWISMTDRMDAVRIYARLGLHPILLWGVTEDGGCTCGRSHDGEGNSIGKHPVHNGWQREPVNVGDLCGALERDWRHNIGLRMGLQPDGSRLVAIDVDGDRSLLTELEAKNGSLPATLTATSGKGMHLLYRLPDGLPMPRNRVRLAPGVDVRSEGGQIVAAPSRHRSGRAYKWLEIREPAELPR